MTWIYSNFKKKIEVKSGYTWSGEQELYENREGSTAVLRVSNIQETLELDDILYLINVSEQHKIDKKISKNWTIAVNSNGNRNRVGKGIFIEEDMEFLFASFLVAFKPFDENEIDPRYFYYWYSSDTIQKRISAIAEGTTGLSNLELRYLKSQDIYHPSSIIEQRYIANTINAVDKTIQATKNSITKLEKLKNSLMQNLLTGIMKPDGSLRDEDDLEQKLIRTIPMRGLQKFVFEQVPRNWDMLKVNDVLELKYGSGLSVDQRAGGKIPVYGSSGITGWHDAKLCSAPGIIVGRKGTVGSVKYCEHDFFVIDTAYYVQPKIEVDWQWLFFILSSLNLPSLNAATGVPGLSRRDAHNLFIPFPPIDEQKEIRNKILCVQMSIEKKEITLNSFKMIKKSLMQNLLTGKIRIPKEVI